MFGELIGLWSALAWERMGRPVPLRLVELGPGRGTLMRDALRAAGRVPGFLDATTVHLVEVSAPLRETQRQAFPPPSRRRRVFDTTWGRDREGGMAERLPL